MATADGMMTVIAVTLTTAAAVAGGGDGCGRGSGGGGRWASKILVPGSNPENH
jgi:hypothetical protein